ncbi:MULTISPECIES: hypothetical protein [unclassified Streptomyces]|uniref:hypothetical protein n=1 Tax=unclassified Streptomyces TaxID=2593676 RepID=UPI0011B03DD8|nr:MULTISPECIES: hypothetical protein [unclassified Streptomyces]
MTSEPAGLIEQKKLELGTSDPRILFEAVCKEAGFETEWSLISDHLYLRVAFPNGREKRWRGISSKSAERHLNLDMNFTYLGEHDAALFKESHTIEATIINVRSSGRRLPEIPGIRRVGSTQLEISEAEAEELEEGEVGGSTTQSTVGVNDAWVLPITPTAAQPELRVEIGSASQDFSKISDFSFRRGSARQEFVLSNGMGRFTTLRIFGVKTTRHDEALAVLKRVSDAVLFELDLHYDLAMKVASSLTADRSRLRGNRFPTTTTDQPPRNPQNQYPEKPLGLYWYGRSSSGIPLLEYLAYYQVLEYFFPSFSHKATLEKLRNELLDPRFRADDNASLVRILGLASGSGRGFGSERDQLKSTVSGCVTEAHVRGLLESDPAFAEHFSGKPVIKDVAKINLSDTKSDLLAAVANRIYDIRCRIVHTKEDGGGNAVDLLLPFSKEAEQLRPDIELVKFISQKALIAGASRLHV